MHSLDDTLEALDNWHFEQFDKNYTNEVVERVKAEYEGLVGQYPACMKAVEDNSDFEFNFKRSSTLSSVGKTISGTYKNIEKALELLNEEEEDEFYKSSEEEILEKNEFLNKIDEKVSRFKQLIYGVQNSPSLDKQEIARNARQLYQSPQEFSEDMLLGLYLVNLTFEVVKEEAEGTEVEAVKESLEMSEILNTKIYQEVFKNIFEY